MRSFSLSLLVGAMMLRFLRAFSTRRLTTQTSFAATTRPSFSTIHRPLSSLPPEISIVDDDDDETNNGDVTDFYAPKVPKSATSAKPSRGSSQRSDVDGDDSSSFYDDAPKKRSAKRKPIRSRTSKSFEKPAAGSSWMDRNQQYASKFGAGESRTFQEDFRGTRLFVQGIPPTASWQDLKDHFKVAGSVVFASISVDNRGESKGHGIIQMETTDMAQTAIDIMRDHPLDGYTLFVRPDMQEKSSGPSAAPRKGQLTSQWKCANPEYVEDFMTDEEVEHVQSMIKRRDQARIKRDYRVSDNLREELRLMGIFCDDRLKLWWRDMENQVPDMVKEIKGDGRWGKQAEWRRIPTTPEQDAMVDAVMVEDLLRRRDKARRAKDFETADDLLERARTSPEGDLNLRIHDESRTWRIWTDAPPPKFPNNGRNSQRDDWESNPSSPEQARERAARQCLQIVEEHAPSKIPEIKMVLEKFPGREFSVLKKLQKKYLE